MSNAPDIRGQMQPNNDFLHKIAGIIPGYKGYVDREQRRDADKMLRMYVARQYREQHSALMRVQQQLAHARQLEAIGELDRLGGVLQRLTDKIETATYGYTGMFDPIKVEAAELDQLYTFDEALLDGASKVGAAVSAVSAASQQGSGPTPGQTAGQLPTVNDALTQLSTVLDDLNQSWNHRQDLLISGQPMASADFDRFKTQTAGSQTTSLPGGATGAGAQQYPATNAPTTGYQASGSYQQGTGAPAGAPVPAGNSQPGQAPSSEGSVTQRLDNSSYPNPAVGGGWDTRTTSMPPSGTQGYSGNVPHPDAGETPEPDNMNTTGGEGMSRTGAIGGSSGADTTPNNLNDSETK